MKELIFAVLVDGENAQHSQYISILKEVEKYGTIAIKWVYADWSDHRLSCWKNLTYETASRTQHQFNHGKDAADHALVMDAIELISNNKRINAVCIVSSDGGFYSLAQRIREKGIHVMAIGNDNTPERFRKACHNFVYAKNLSIQDKPKIHNELESLLLDSYKRCAETNEPVYLGDFGTMLKTIDSSFDPRSYGAPTLKKLIREKDNLFEIVNERVDRCFIALKSQILVSQYIDGEIRKWDASKGFGFIKSAKGDYYFNKTAWNSPQEIKSGAKVSFTSSALPSSTSDSKAECPQADSVTCISL